MSKNAFLKLALIASLLLNNYYGAGQADSNLFRSATLTVSNSFTSGVEGPAVDREGNLYAVNFHHNGTIGKITPSGEQSVFIELPAGSIGNGIRFDSKGNMFIADYTGHNILKVSMQTKQISVFSHESKMNQPNDIAITLKNTFYASDPDWKNGTGKLWYINKKGKAILLGENMGTTNGVEVSPDNKRLYVNESVQRNIWVYDIKRNGTITNKRLLIGFQEFGMDGMRCDALGNLYIARMGKGTVAIVSPEGKLVREIKLIGTRPTNVAFGGPDGKTVYVTMQDQGNIETFRTDTPGQEWKNSKKNLYPL